MHAETEEKPRPTQRVMGTNHRGGNVFLQKKKIIFTPSFEGRGLFSESFAVPLLKKLASIVSISITGVRGKFLGSRQR